MLENERAEWDYWRRRMTESARCNNGRAAGVWALEVLESQLSSDWLAKSIQREGSPPSEVTSASFHAVAYAELLTLAASLELGKQIPGMARIRSSLKTDFREESRRHAFAQIELAMLAMHSEVAVSLEKRLEVGSPQVDALLSKGSVVVPVEVRIVLLDESTRAGRHLADILSAGLMQLQFSGDVIFDGTIAEDITEDDVASLLAAAGAATTVAVDQSRSVRVEHPLTDLQAVPFTLAAPGTTLTIPAGTGPGIRRVSWILRSKVEQTAKSGATWLRVDLLDGESGGVVRLRTPR